MSPMGGAGGGSPAGGTDSTHNNGDSIILEEEIDPNYEPTNDEVMEYAKWLGMDLVMCVCLVYKVFICVCVFEVMSL